VLEPLYTFSDLVLIVPRRA